MGLRNLNFQISPGISYNLYRFHNVNGNKITLSGPGAEVGFGAYHRLNPHWSVGGKLKLNFLQAGKTTTTTTSGLGSSYSTKSHQAYRFFQLRVEPMALWKANKKWVVNFGPYIGANLYSRYRNYGTTTQTTGSTSTTTDYGSKSFSKLNGIKQNIQFGINAGVAYNLFPDRHEGGIPVQPFLNVGYGLNNVLAINEDNRLVDVAAGGNIDIMQAPATHEKTECKASSITRELKIGFALLEDKAKSLENIANKIPRVEAKLTVKPQLTVKQGEECCTKEGPVVSYTELKAGVEVNMEVNINLWGIPDLDYSVDLWGAKVSAEFRLKVFAGPAVKANFDVIGKAYGELFNPTSTGACKSCVYMNFKEEGFLRVGIKAGGSVNITFWPYYETKSGFKVKRKPDETIEASAEASVSIGCTFNGTWAGLGECLKPKPGLHGALNIGKGKANLKFKLELGPLSFDPNFEVSLFDGWKVEF